MFTSFQAKCDAKTPCPSWYLYYYFLVGQIEAKPRWERWQKQTKRLPLSALRTLAALSIFFPLLSLFSTSLFSPSAAGYKAAGVVVLLSFEDLFLQPVWWWENVYVVQCIVVSSQHFVLVRVETALKHYLNHWTLQYSSKSKRIFISYLGLHCDQVSKKYFMVRETGGKRLEIRCKCTVQAIKSYRAFNFSICKGASSY